MGAKRIHPSFLEQLGREVLRGRQNLGPIFGRSLIDLIKQFPLALGPGGLCQGSKSLSWDYFGCGSEKPSHVIDSG